MSTVGRLPSDASPAALQSLGGVEHWEGSLALGSRGPASDGSQAQQAQREEEHGTSSIPNVLSMWAVPPSCADSNALGSSPPSSTQGASLPSPWKRSPTVVSPLTRDSDMAASQAGRGIGRGFIPLVSMTLAPSLSLGTAMTPELRSGDAAEGVVPAAGGEGAGARPPAPTGAGMLAGASDFQGPSPLFLAAAAGAAGEIGAAMLVGRVSPPPSAAGDGLLQQEQLDQVAGPSGQQQQQQQQASGGQPAGALGEAAAVEATGPGGAGSLTKPGQVARDAAILAVAAEPAGAGGEGKLAVKPASASGQEASEAAEPTGASRAGVPAAEAGEEMKLALEAAGADGSEALPHEQLAHAAGLYGPAAPVQQPPAASQQGREQQQQQQLLLQKWPSWGKEVGEAGRGAAASPGLGWLGVGAGPQPHPSQVLGPSDALPTQPIGTWSAVPTKPPVPSAPAHSELAPAAVPPGKPCPQLAFPGTQVLPVPDSKEDAPSPPVSHTLPVAELPPILPNLPLTQPASLGPAMQPAEPAVPATQAAGMPVTQPGSAALPSTQAAATQAAAGGPATQLVFPAVPPTQAVASGVPATQPATAALAQTQAAAAGMAATQLVFPITQAAAAGVPATQLAFPAVPPTQAAAAQAAGMPATQLVIPTVPPTQVVATQAAATGMPATQPAYAALPLTQPIAAGMAATPPDEAGVPALAGVTSMQPTTADVPATQPAAVGVPPTQPLLPGAGPSQLQLPFQLLSIPDSQELLVDEALLALEARQGSATVWAERKGEASPTPTAPATTTAAAGPAAQQPPSTGSKGAARGAAAHEAVPAQQGSAPASPFLAPRLEGSPPGAGVPSAEGPVVLQSTATALEEAERELRRRWLRPSQVSGLGSTRQGTEASDPAVGTTEPSWAPTEDMAQGQQPQSGTQELMASFRFALLEGDPTGSLRSFVCSEVVRSAALALWGRDYQMLPAADVDTWQRVLWQEFQRQGLGAGLCFEDSQPKQSEGRDLPPLGDLNFDVEGFLCTEAEVEQRRQRLGAGLPLLPQQATVLPSGSSSPSLGPSGTPAHGPSSPSAVLQEEVSSAAAGFAGFSLPRGSLQRGRTPEVGGWGGAEQQEQQQQQRLGAGEQRSDEGPEPSLLTAQELAQVPGTEAVQGGEKVAAIGAARRAPGPRNLPECSKAQLGTEPTMWDPLLGALPTQQLEMDIPPTQANECFGGASDRAQQQLHSSTRPKAEAAAQPGGARQVQGHFSAMPRVGLELSEARGKIPEAIYVNSSYLRQWLGHSTESMYGGQAHSSMKPGAAAAATTSAAIPATAPVDAVGMGAAAGADGASGVAAVALDGSPTQETAPRPLAALVMSGAPAGEYELAGPALGPATDAPGPLPEPAPALAAGMAVAQPSHHHEDEGAGQEQGPEQKQQAQRSKEASGSPSRHTSPQQTAPATDASGPHAAEGPPAAPPVATSPAAGQLQGQSPPPLQLLPPQSSQLPSLHLDQLLQWGPPQWLLTIPDSEDQAQGLEPPLLAAAPSRPVPAATKLPLPKALQSPLAKRRAPQQQQQQLTGGPWAAPQLPLALRPSAVTAAGGQDSGPMGSGRQEAMPARGRQWPRQHYKADSDDFGPGLEGPGSDSSSGEGLWRPHAGTGAEKQRLLRRRGEGQAEPRHGVMKRGTKRDRAEVQAASAQMLVRPGRHSAARQVPTLAAAAAASPRAAAAAAAAASQAAPAPQPLGPPNGAAARPQDHAKSTVSKGVAPLLLGGAKGAMGPPAQAHLAQGRPASGKAAAVRQLEQAQGAARSAPTPVETAAAAAAMQTQGATRSRVLAEAMAAAGAAQTQGPVKPAPVPAQLTAAAAAAAAAAQEPQAVSGSAAGPAQPSRSEGSPGEGSPAVVLPDAPRPAWPAAAPSPATRLAPPRVLVAGEGAPSIDKEMERVHEGEGKGVTASGRARPPPSARLAARAAKGPGRSALQQLANVPCSGLVCDEDLTFSCITQQLSEPGDSTEHPQAPAGTLPPGLPAPRAAAVTAPAAAGALRAGAQEGAAEEVQPGTRLGRSRLYDAGRADPFRFPTQLSDPLEPLPARPQPHVASGTRAPAGRGGPSPPCRPPRPLERVRQPASRLFQQQSGGWQPPAPQAKQRQQQLGPSSAKPTAGHGQPAAEPPPLPSPPPQQGEGDDGASGSGGQEARHASRHAKRTAGQGSSPRKGAKGAATGDAAAGGAVAPAGGLPVPSPPRRKRGEQRQEQQQQERQPASEQKLLSRASRGRKRAATPTEDTPACEAKKPRRNPPKGHNPPEHQQQGRQQGKAPVSVRKGRPGSAGKKKPGSFEDRSYGCSKCRWSKKGCGKCRAEGAAKAEQSPKQAQAAAAATAPALCRRRSSVGAAPAAPPATSPGLGRAHGRQQQQQRQGSIVAAPSPQQRQQEAGTGTAAAALEPKRQRRSGPQQEQPGLRLRSISPQRGPHSTAAPFETQPGKAPGGIPAAAPRGQPSPVTGSAAVAWVGEPHPPPPGLPGAPHRQFYGAFSMADRATGGRLEVRLGDCVELSAAAGETETRLAQVLALYAERAAGGRQLMLARVQRYYRPQDVMAAEGSAGHAWAPAELVMTTHVEDRVHLRAVLGRCTVVRQLQQRQQRGAGQVGAGGQYVCRLQYDCATGELAPLGHGAA